MPITIENKLRPVSGEVNSLFFKLPSELLCLVFSYLKEMQDWARVARVCRRWNVQIVSETGLYILARLQRLNPVMQITQTFSLNTTLPCVGYSFIRVNETGSFTEIQDYRSRRRWIYNLASSALAVSNERCMGFGHKYSFFCSDNPQQLVIRDALTMKKIEEFQIGELLGKKKDQYDDYKLLHAFELLESESKFVTVSQGIIVEWQLRASRVEKLRELKIFKKRCTETRRITRALQNGNLLICDAHGSITGLSESKSRKRNVTFGVDLETFKIVDFRRFLAGFDITSDRIIIYNHSKIKAYPFPKQYEDNICSLLGEISKKSWSVKCEHFRNFGGVNDRWYVFLNDHKMEVLKVNNGKLFLYLYFCPGAVPQVFLHDDFLIFVYNQIVELVHIPTKQVVKYHLDIQTLFSAERAAALRNILITSEAILLLCVSKDENQDKLVHILRASFNFPKMRPLVPIHDSFYQPPANLSPPPTPVVTPPVVAAPLPVPPAPIAALVLNPPVNQPHPPVNVAQPPVVAVPPPAPVAPIAPVQPSPAIVYNGRVIAQGLPVVVMLCVAEFLSLVGLVVIGKFLYRFAQQRMRK